MQNVSRIEKRLKLTSPIILFGICLTFVSNLQYVPANGSDLKFLVNLSQLKQFGQSQRREKINGSMSLFMKATIPGTHGSIPFEQGSFGLFTWRVENVEQTAKLFFKFRMEYWIKNLHFQFANDSAAVKKYKQDNFILILRCVIM